MHLAQILFTQGFGTRRICAGIVAASRVRIGGRVVDDPHADPAAIALLRKELDDVPLTFDNFRD